MAEICGRRIEYEQLHPDVERPGRPTLVFLHEGLGSVSMWKDFPGRVVAATGCPALVYSRPGHGRSALPSRPRGLRYLHDEATDVLPALLNHFDIRSSVLLDHSDGGSIALIAAGSGSTDPSGLIVMAPHVMVEDVTIRAITAARDAYENTDLRDRLGRFHADPDHVFRAWNDVWLRPDFRGWNIEEYLPTIGCPILALQGEGDEYATLDQIERIARRAHRVELLAVPDCGHSPHRDQPLTVIGAISRFVDSLPSPTAG